MAGYRATAAEFSASAGGPQSGPVDLSGLVAEIERQLLL